MKRASILGLAFVVAAGLLWTLLASRSARDEEVATAPRVTAQVPPDRSEPLPAPRSLSKEEYAPSTDTSARVARRITAATSDAARFEESPAPEDGLLVRVVTEDTTPVPGATVFWFEGSSMTDTDEARFGASGFEVNELFETYGRRFRADERGHVVVPHPTGGVTLLGRGEELSGLGSPRADMPDFELVLAPDPALRVRVVDASGTPVGGVVVGLRLRGGDDDGSFDILRARTDVDGRAAIEHSVPLMDLIDDGDSVRVGVVAPLMFAVEKQIDVAALKNEVELVLPAFGSVALRLVDADGEPASGSHLIALGWGDDHDAAKGSGPRDRSATFWIEEGVLALTPVALGLELGYEIATLQHEELATGAFAGPVRAGERVEWEIEVARPTYLIGRLLLPGGEPCVSRIVSFALGREEHWETQRRRLRTGVDGAFRFELSDLSAADGGLFLVELHAERSAAVELSQRVTLPARVELGTNDLGEVMLERAPILVAGTVVDEGGDGIEGAEVWVDAAAHGSSSEGDWSRVTRGTAATGSDGAFAIRGYGRRTSLRVRAECSGYVEGSRGASTALGVSFESGDTAVRVPLQTAGAIEVRVLVDSGHAPELRVTRFGGPEQRDEVDRSTVEYLEPGFGRVVLVGLEEGLYTVTVEGVWGPTLGRFESVVVRGGETARAGDVDLRGLLRSVSIRVSDADGTPISCSASSGDGESVWISDDDGSIRITTLEDPLDVTVESFGYRAAELLDVRGGESVVLASGFGVNLELAGGKPRALRESEMLSIQLRPLNGEAVEPGERGAHGRFDEEGRCQLVSGDAGPHRVHVRLWVIEEGGAWKTAELDDPAFASLRVLDPGPTRAVLRVTGAMIDDARRRARVPGARR